MLLFLCIIFVIATLGYYLITITFLLINRKKFSPRLPEQLKVYRWIYALTLALDFASLLTLVVMRFANLSDLYLYVIWAALFVVFFIGLFIFAKYTITEWFLPFQKLPKLPLHYIPRNKRSIALIILITIIVLLFVFPKQ